MAINNLTHFVLVDFENVPGIDLSVLCDEPMVVVLFLGAKSKLKPALVEQITERSFEVRLIKVGQIKKNAADFVLAYHLGEMVTRYPRGHYYIISGDLDFKPLITHLRDHCMHVSQHGSLEELPFLTPPKATAPVAKPVKPKPAPAGQPVQPVLAPKPSVAPVAPAVPPKLAKLPKPVVVKKAVPTREENIIAKLKNPQNRSRPSTMKSLQAHLKTALGKQAADGKVDALIAQLRNELALEIDAAGKVSYL
jgi:hypothetical protein